MNEIVEFEKAKVMEIFEGMEFECSVLNNGFIAKQSGAWTIVTILQDKYDELQMFGRIKTTKTKAGNGINV